MTKQNLKIIVILFIALCSCVSRAETRFIIVASTTSTQNSGLFDKILPIFKSKSGIEVRVVAVGTGQALRLAQNGDADVLFVHHKSSELDFVKKGFGVKRFDVMYNDFVIIGPQSDPANIRNVEQVKDAFTKIANSGNNFISRGDNSGTHKRELSLWRAASINPKKHAGKWYQEVGAGMGATLNITAAKAAYTLTDRGTWLSFKNKTNLAILFDGDKKLLNPYGVILVNPNRYRHIKADDGQKFIDWLISKEGQVAINNYKIDSKQLFFSNANCRQNNMKYEKC